MISASNVVLDGHHAHGLGHGPGPGPGGPHHLPFDSYLRSKPPQDFTRPYPKSGPLVPRLNGQRPSPSQSPRKDYPNVPVNLTSVKHEGDISTTSVNIPIPHPTAAYSAGMFAHPGFSYASLANPYEDFYANSYSTMLNRSNYINSKLLRSLDGQYSPTQKTNSNPNSPGVFLQPPASYTNPNPPQAAPPPPPPVSAKLGQPLLREKRPFKVPPGKETNCKQRLPSSGKSAAKRVSLSSHINNNNNNNLLPPNFTKGSLIQLANGDLRRVEDVTTEELVSSAERCPAFRFDPSTVVGIEENNHGTVLLTLSYGENKKTIEMESTLEHPYYVFGQGWASCSPERTMSCYGLQCHRLQVGDVCISLSPRQNQEPTATTTANSTRYTP